MHIHVRHDSGSQKSLASAVVVVFSFVYGGCCVSVCRVYAGLNMALGPLKLRLQVFMSRHLGTGSRGLWERSQ